jgi:hypothetical protein
MCSPSPSSITWNDGFKKRLSTLFGMIRNIDWNMGKLMKFLDDENLAKDTILIFKTDNGSLLGPQYFNAGMRGKKTEIWEGGHRVPCFIRWPKGGLGNRATLVVLLRYRTFFPRCLIFAKSSPRKRPPSTASVLHPCSRGKSKYLEDRVLIINYSRMPGFSNYPSPHSQTQMRADQAAVLWKRWRLLEDRELYNLATDPMQKKNVINQHPEVVAKMRKPLYEWWEGVKDLANEAQNAAIIGTQYENPTKLSATEWLDVFVDQQGQIRRGVLKNGYWLIDVARAGEYEIELRRWPKEADGTISGTLPDGSGTALPINQAMLFMSGHNHLKNFRKEVLPVRGTDQDGKSKRQRRDLHHEPEERPTALHTWFKGRDGIMLSAYYVPSFESNFHKLFPVDFLGYGSIPQRIIHRG